MDLQKNFRADEWVFLEADRKARGGKIPPDPDEDRGDWIGKFKQIIFRPDRAGGNQIAALFCGFQIFAEMPFRSETSSAGETFQFGKEFCPDLNVRVPRILFQGEEVVVILGSNDRLRAVVFQRVMNDELFCSGRMVYVLQ